MTITAKQYLESVLSFRYISNLAIITAVISYYTNAYNVFFVMIPLVIANLIVILLVQWFDSDKLFHGVFKNKPLDIYLDSDDQGQFILLNTIWHIIPVIWLYGIIKRDDIIKVFHPNFMGVFMQAALIAVIYFYCGSMLSVYGDIDYLWYGGIYIAVLFIICFMIFTI